MPAHPHHTDADQSTTPPRVSSQGRWTLAKVLGLVGVNFGVHALVWLVLYPAWRPYAEAVRSPESSVLYALVWVVAMASAYAPRPASDAPVEIRRALPFAQGFAAASTALLIATWVVLLRSPVLDRSDAFSLFAASGLASSSLALSGLRVREWRRRLDRHARLLGAVTGRG